VKLALGTVQFGMPYGIANRTGQVEQEEIGRILATAREAGIRTIDTAIAYGDSEERLGRAGISGFEVVSKLPSLKDNATPIAELVEGALRRLKLERLHGLLLHRSADLAGPGGEAVFADMEALCERGLVGKIGVSIYAPAELDTIVPRLTIGIVQAPYNAFDRSLAASGWLERLKAAGIEVHTRSALLQGLLVMPPAERPPKFAPWRESFARWDSWLAANGLTALEGALSAAGSTPGIDRVVVGVDSNVQLREIVAAAAVAAPPVPTDMAVADPRLINPGNWTSL
jgi:aryl-alcohol dehydrogenase-like predicted oxidoreductase